MCALYGIVSNTTLHGFTVCRVATCPMYSQREGSGKVNTDEKYADGEYHYISPQGFQV